MQKNEDILVVCSNCGEVIPKDSNFCKGCGARLNGSERLYNEAAADNTSSQNSAASKSSGGKKSAKNSNRPEEKKNKQLSGTQVIYLIIGLAVIGFILIYASGIFDSGSTALPVESRNQPGSDTKLASLPDINAQEELVKKNPNDLDNLLKLGHMLNDAGFYQKAIEKYQMYLKSKPKEADVIVDMGVCYFQTGQYQTAIANFKKGIELNPKHQIAHLNLGVVYNFGLNNKTEAVKWWKKALELDPASEIGKRAQEFLNQNK